MLLWSKHVSIVFKQWAKTVVILGFSFHTPRSFDILIITIITVFLKGLNMFHETIFSLLKTDSFHQNDKHGYSMNISYSARFSDSGYRASISVLLKHNFEKSACFFFKHVTQLTESLTHFTEYLAKYIAK